METKEQNINQMKMVVDKLPRSLFRGFKLYVCEQLEWSIAQWENRYYGRTKATPAEIISITKLAQQYAHANKA